MNNINCIVVIGILFVLCSCQTMNKVRSTDEYKTIRTVAIEVAKIEGKKFAFNLLDKFVKQGKISKARADAIKKLIEGDKNGS